MTKLNTALWRDIMDYMRHKHATICRRWFEELEPVDLTSGVLRVHASNGVQRHYLQLRCRDQFTEAAQAATGALVTVQFVDERFVDGSRHDHTASADTHGRPGTGEHGTAGPSRAPARATATALLPPGAEDQMVISPDYSFENFVTGPGNRLAHAAAIAVADQPGVAYNPLFIHGGVGLGKTHLLQAICQQVLQEAPDIRVCYLSCDSFVNQFLNSVQKGQMNEFRQLYRVMDVLVIDDIQFLANRDRTQEEFFHTFNQLYQANRQIVLSSDSPPAEIPQLEERLVSRFQGGFVVTISKPSFETRVAILRAKATLRQLNLPDDVISYIATKIDSNARELEGALNRVQGYASIQERPIDLALAQDALGEPSGGSHHSQVTLQQIIDLVTGYYNVKLSDLQSKRRQKSVSGPRQVSMYLARKRTHFSLEQIGGYFGGRDHTTVMHAIKVVDQRLSQDHAFARQVEQLDDQIKNGSRGR